MLIIIKKGRTVFFLNFMLLCKSIIGKTPSLTVRPKHVFKNPGDHVVAVCLVSDAQPALINNMTWTDPSGRVIQSEDESSRLTVFSSDRTLLQLLIRNLKKEDVGIYTCSATSIINKTLKETMEVTIYSNIDFKDTELVQNIKLHSDAKIRCVVVGAPSPVVDWAKDSLPMKNSERIFQERDGLIIKGVTERDEGIYRCRGRIARLGAISHRNIQVNVYEPPTIIGPLRNVVGKRMQTVSFQCRATGKPAPVYIWMNKDCELLDEKVGGYSVNNETGELTIAHLKMNHAGEYWCIAENDFGRDSATAKLTVLTTTDEPKAVAQILDMVELQTSRSPGIPTILGVEPNKLTRTASDHYNLRWKATSDKGYNIVYYQVQKTPNGWDPVTSENRVVLSISGKTNYWLDGLKSNAYYKIEVSALTDLNENTSSRQDTVIIQTDSNGTTDEIQCESFLHHMAKFSNNVFLEKHVNASPVYSKELKKQMSNAVDGDSGTSYFSKIVTNPWFFVDLGASYLIWEIRIIMSGQSNIGATTIYLANGIHFHDDGRPDVKSLPIFYSQSENSSRITSMWTFRKPHGMQGRYVVLSREIENNSLIIYEFQGTGYFMN